MQYSTKNKFRNILKEIFAVLGLVWLIQLNRLFIIPICLYIAWELLPVVRDLPRQYRLMTGREKPMEPIKVHDKDIIELFERSTNLRILVNNTNNKEEKLKLIKEHKEASDKAWNKCYKEYDLIYGKDYMFLGDSKTIIERTFEDQLKNMA